MPSVVWESLPNADLIINNVYKVQQINPPGGFRRGFENGNLRYLGKERGHNPSENEMEAYIFENLLNGSSVSILDNVKHLYQVQHVPQAGGARLRRQTRRQTRRRKQSRRRRL